MSITKAEIRPLGPDGLPVNGKTIVVLYNPTEITINQGATYAEIGVPGKREPLLQYVRGNLDTLSAELFLDRTPQRADVEADLTALRKLIRHEGPTHAPPVVEFAWGCTSFKGVVTTLNERFVLFDPTGKVERARVTLELKRWLPATDTTPEPSESPDRTETWVVRQGDRLDWIAAHAYGDPNAWRPIAEANGLLRPRALVPGTVLLLPAL